MISVFGVIAVEDVDKDQEKFIVEGVDASRLKNTLLLRDHNAKIHLVGAVGRITEVNVVLTETDRNSSLIRMFRQAGCKPFVGIHALIWDSTIEAIINSGHPIYFGLGGVTLETSSDGGVKLIKRSTINYVTFTLRGSHEAYRVLAW